MSNFLSGSPKMLLSWFGLFQSNPNRNVSLHHVASFLHNKCSNGSKSNGFFIRFFGCLSPDYEWMTKQLSINYFFSISNEFFQLKIKPTVNIYSGVVKKRKKKPFRLVKHRTEHKTGPINLDRVSALLNPVSYLFNLDQKRMEKKIAMRIYFWKWKQTRTETANLVESVRFINRSHSAQSNCLGKTKDLGNFFLSFACLALAHKQTANH